MNFKSLTSLTIALLTFILTYSYEKNAMIPSLTTFKIMRSSGNLTSLIIKLFAVLGTIRFREMSSKTVIER
jgi:hypothetical protein